jgi:hypothetical protein
LLLDPAGMLSLLRLEPGFAGELMSLSGDHLVATSSFPLLVHREVVFFYLPEKEKSLGGWHISVIR